MHTVKNKLTPPKPARYFFLGCSIIAMVLVLSAYPARTVEPSYIRHKTNIPKEYEIKAVYLYNFLQFVTWPEDKCGLPDGRARKIIVIGDSSVEGILKNLQAKLKAQGRDLALTFHHSYQKNMNLADCCLIFISDSELEHLPEILAKLAGRPVLTVADSDAFEEDGAMITLISRQNKIRWAIDRRPVKESGLRLSAKLLEIAVQVTD